MPLPRLFLSLVLLSLFVASCSNPERVRVASAPLPPLPRAKPLDSAGGAGGIINSAPTAEIEVATLEPGRSHVSTTEERTASAQGATAEASAVESEPSTSVAEGSMLRPQASSYVVQPGDTLFSISQRFEVPLAAMIDANDLSPPFGLAVGQRLRIPSVRVYEVRSGESLYAIAERHGVSAEELAQANRLEEPYRLWGGQRLVLPGSLPNEAAAGEVDVTLAEAAAAAAPAAGTTEDLAREQEVPGLAAPQDPEPEPSTSGSTANGSSGEVEAEGEREAPRVAAIPSPPPRSGGRFLWPLQGEMIAGFGAQGDGRHNDGINIAAERGTKVVAAENGVVAYAGNELRGFGNLLLIKHADDWITAYAHNDRLLVNAGDSVTRGQAIAEVGSTGSVARPQLHFEIRKGTRAVDPLPLLEGAGG